MPAATICPRTETYRDVEKLLWKMVHDFRRRNGGDLDELYSVACEAYCIAYQSYDPSKGASFSTWVCWQVLGWLRTAARKERYHSIEKSAGDNTYEWEDTMHVFDSDMIAESLSTDAAYVFRLATKPPTELASAAAAKGGSGVNWRTTLRSYLKNLGWAKNRIVESFDEIAVALEDWED